MKKSINYQLKSNSTSLPPVLSMNGLKKIMIGMSIVDKIRIIISLFPPYIIESIRNINKTMKSIDFMVNKNEENVKTTASKIFIEAFEVYAKSIGIATIGYTKIAEEHLLQGENIMYPNVIIVSMEMDKKLIAKSPSRKTRLMVLDTHKNLNELAIMLTHYLQKNGFGAQPGSDLKGLAHYPWIAEKACMGMRGKHGLVITEELGPRQRLAIISTSIENLPILTVNKHSWIKEFCEKCNKCIRSCPAQALYEKPIENDGIKIHISHEKCLKEFARNDACSVCLAKCVLNTGDYSKIKASFLKNNT